MSKRELKITRRNLLLNAASGAGIVLLSGCEKTLNKLTGNDTVRAILGSAEQANRRLQRLFAGRNKLAQEFSEKEILPISAQRPARAGDPRIPRRRRQQLAGLAA